MSWGSSTTSLDTVLARSNARFDALYHCRIIPTKATPENPFIKSIATVGKPKPGMLPLDAVRDFNIDLANLVLLATPARDIEAGKRRRNNRCR